MDPTKINILSRSIKVGLLLGMGAVISGCDSLSNEGVEPTSGAGTSPDSLNAQVTPSEINQIFVDPDESPEDAKLAAWTGAPSGNWNDPQNWAEGEVPGQVTFDWVVMSGTQDSKVVPYEFKANALFSARLQDEATLEIAAPMSPFKDLFLGHSATATGGHVTQLAGSNPPVVNVQDDLKIGLKSTSNSTYTVTGGSLTVGDNIYIQQGSLIVNGTAASIQTGAMKITESGGLTFNFGSSGVSPIDVTGAFAVSEDAKLKIDLRGYNIGGNKVELVSFGSMTGSFDRSNITIVGLDGGVVSVEGNSLYVTVTDDVDDQANTLWFLATGGDGSQSSDLQVNTGSRTRDLTSPYLTYTQRTRGDDLISTVNWSGSDFDGDGANDTISFDVRVRGFSDSIFTYDVAPDSSSATLGPADDVSSASSMWGVGTDGDLDAGESMRFGVENLVISTGTGSFDGFTAFQVAEPNGGNNHQIILGLGDDRESFTTSASTANFPLDSKQNVYLTSAGNTSGAAAIGRMTLQFSVSDIKDYLAQDSNDYSSTIVGSSYGSNGDYPAETRFNNFPAFSWDTVPRWASMIVTGAGLSDEDAERIAKNHQVISLGKDSSTPFREDGNLISAALLKSYNPDIKTLFYRNSEIHYDAYLAGESYDESEWSDFNLDDDGARVYQDTRNFLTFNDSHPAMRQWWIDTSVDMLVNPLIDGLFIDKATSQGYPLLNGAGQIEPSTNRLKMYHELSTQVPNDTLLVGNILRNERTGGDRELMHLFEGSYIERWENPIGSESEADARAVSIQLMREAALKGKILMPALGDRLDNSYLTAEINAGNIDELIETIQEGVVLPLAYFLIVAEEYSYFRYQPDQNLGYPDYVTDPTAYVDELNRPLGAPLGPPVKNGYVYTRSFEHVDVWLNVETDTARLSWR